MFKETKMTIDEAINIALDGGIEKMASMVYCSEDDANNPHLGMPVIIGPGYINSESGKEIWPPTVADLGFMEYCSVERLVDVVENAKYMKVSLSVENLFKRLEFYLEHDTFMR
jgi:hypothetical protein